MSRHDSIDYRDKICTVCEKQFTPNTGRQVYCSDVCRLGRATCHGCGKRFVKTKNTTGKYCSSECWYKAPGKKEIPVCSCKECKREFQPSSSTTRFCSRECSKIGLRRTRKNLLCLTCEKELVGDANRKVRFCSHSCALAGRKKPNMKTVRPEGARKTNFAGYIVIKVNGKWVLEHRYVVEQKLGRPLVKTEHVHHLNGQKSDNRPENLEIWKKRHPHGVRSSDYHCVGCRCHVRPDTRIVPH